MSRHFFTPEDDKTILTLRAAGLSQVQISMTMGLLLGGVCSRIDTLRKAGVTTEEELAARGGSVLRQYLTAEQGATIKAMHDAGMSFKDISAETGIPVGSVHRHVKKAKGLPAMPSDEIAARAAHAKAKREQYARLFPFMRQKTSVEMVRCLGGCGQMFASPDRMRIRVCKTCKERHRAGGINDASDFSLRL